MLLDRLITRARPIRPALTSVSVSESAVKRSPESPNGSTSTIPTRLTATRLLYGSTPTVPIDGSVSAPAPAPAPMMPATWLP